ncbi:hypothetical protein [Stratiformator vulcanicus]|uniref:Uncharacterized protein n=1 Tax=Stratiformator vulcanicus TaxID=2527980 RepID=A0A517R0S2_9PLAN|nr:hypothetical protein [Stratiformator vulcanicus]QDT37471.1 hypothetical protein Pan189_18510 [Stratiformator vulcanicus]
MPVIERAENRGVAADAIDNALTLRFGSNVEVRERHPLSLWIRVQSEEFSSLDREGREDLFWAALESVDSEMVQTISSTRLKAPGEETSFSDYIFDNPPSSETLN